MIETHDAQETRENRIKRLHMRSMRRGIKEMDILLSAYAAQNLAQMDDAKLDLYDRLLRENDQDLYQWVTHQSLGPQPLQALIQEISETYQK